MREPSLLFFYSEFWGEMGVRCALFLLGGEVGGRAFDERLNFVFRITGGKRNMERRVLQWDWKERMGLIILF